MSNIVTVLKDEVSRIARKEVRNETAQLKKAVARYVSIFDADEIGKCSGISYLGKKQSH